MRNGVLPFVVTVFLFFLGIRQRLVIEFRNRFLMSQESLLNKDVLEEPPRRLLITGGSGYIGSHMLLHILDQPDGGPYFIVSVDELSRK